MAVTKIHRTSRLTLITTIIVSLIVLGLFFFGGQAPEHEKIGADLAQPAFTDILLYWMYALLVITIVVLIAFSIVDFARGLKENPKKALSGLYAILALAALLSVLMLLVMVHYFQYQVTKEPTTCHQYLK